MAINWGLAQVDNAPAYFQFGLQLGDHFQQRKRERDTRNALAAYAESPGDETLKGVMTADPRLGVQLRGQEQKLQAEARERAIKQLPVQVGLLRNVTDESSYQQARQTAALLGIDLSNVPETYGDGTWVRQALPQLEEAMKLVGGGQDPTALMQNMAYLRQLNPNMTDEEAAAVAQYAIAAPRMYGSPEMGWSPDPNYPFARQPAQPAQPTAGEGQIAVNPQTGERLQLRNGQWVPMGGGASNGVGGFPSGQ